MYPPRLITYTETNTEFFISERFIGELFIILTPGTKDWDMRAIISSQ